MLEEVESQDLGEKQIQGDEEQKIEEEEEDFKYDRALYDPAALDDDEDVEFDWTPRFAVLF